jgi:GT2 family glycosyltransferase
LSILDGRNRTTREAMDAGADFFWFLDDDIVPPEDALPRLLAAGHPFVSGVCTTRALRPHVCCAVLDPRGRYRWGRDDWSWPGEPFPVDAVGLGCALVTRPVLEAIGPDDWFRWNWKRTLPDGRTVLQSKGEDVWLCEKAREKRFAIHVDPNVRCLHVDRRTGASYPSPVFWEARRRSA